MAENESYPTPSVPSDQAATNMTPRTAGTADPADNAETAGWHSPTQGGMTTPIAPEGGIPAYPGNSSGTNGSNSDLTAPTPQETETPGSRMVFADNFMNPPTGSSNNMAAPAASQDSRWAFPGNLNCPSCSPSSPVFPGFPSLPGIPNLPTVPSAPSFPTFPSVPSVPSIPETGTGYGQVRFLNASTNTFPVTFTINGVPYSSSASFGTISSYQPISDGFHTVMVRRSAGMQTVLLQQTFPFSANRKVTMVLVDAREGGLEMIQISDTGCTNLPSGYGCYRVVNASYSGSSFDVRMANGDTVFRNVTFTQATSYKRALAGTYTFYLTNTNFYSVMRELPIIIIGAITGTNPLSRPLTSGNVSIRAGQNTTTYIIGNTWSAYSLRMFTVND